MFFFRGDNRTNLAHWFGSIQGRAIRGEPFPYSRRRSGQAGCRRPREKRSSRSRLAAMSMVSPSKKKTSKRSSRRGACSTSPMPTMLLLVGPRRRSGATRLKKKQRTPSFSKGERGFRFPRLSREKKEERVKTRGKRNQLWLARRRHTKKIDRQEKPKSPRLFFLPF